jgi:hypothetical protein
VVDDQSVLGEDPAAGGEAAGGAVVMTPQQTKPPPSLMTLDGNAEASPAAATTKDKAKGATVTAGLTVAAVSAQGKSFHDGVDAYEHARRRIIGAKRMPLLRRLLPRGMKIEPLPQIGSGQKQRNTIATS